MCKSKADGGERCQGTPTGKALYRLYRLRRDAMRNNDKQESEALRRQIEAVKEASQIYGGKIVSPHRIHLSEGVEKVLSTLKKTGNPLIVGGAVRDSLLGVSNKDIDIEVHDTRIDKLISTLREDGFHVDEVGKQFGVLKVSKKNVVSDIDVSVPRKENNVGAGHRNFEVIMDSEMTIEEAGARRDFTFNSIMYDHERKVIVDPYNGADDLHAGILRHVSPAFAEDPLRVLRAFQFSGRFDLTADEGTVKMCRSLRSQYDTLPSERVVDEWEKFYSKSQNPSKGIRVLQQTGWDNTFNGLQDSLKSKATVQALNKLPSLIGYDKSIMGASIIARGMKKPSDKAKFIRGTIVSLKRQNVAKNIVEFDANEVHSHFEVKQSAQKLHSTGFTFRQYEAYCSLVDEKDGLRVCKMARESGVYDAPEPPLIQGRDVMEHTKIRGGKWLGDLLDEVMEKQYQGKFGNKKEALEYALARIP